MLCERGGVAHGSIHAGEGAHQAKKPQQPGDPQRAREGSPASARAWLEVASVGYLFARLRVEPT